MTTLTGIVASVVVHSSAAAFSHFGLTLQAMPVEKAPAPAAQRVVARSHPVAQKIVDCPTRAARPRVDKA